MALPSEDGSCHVRSSISDDAMAIAIDQSCPQFDIAFCKASATPGAESTCPR